MSASKNTPKGLHTYRRLLQAVKQYWVIFLLGIVGTLLLSVTDAVFSWAIKPLINEGFIHRSSAFLKLLPLGIVIIFVVRAVSGFMSTYYISRVSRNIVRDFRRRLFSKFLKMPASFYDAQSSGHLLSTVIYNVEQVADASSSALMTIMREASLAIGLITVMFVVSWKLALLFLVMAPLVGWVTKWSSKRMRRLSTNVQASVGDVTQIADEGIQGYKVIRLFGGERYEYQKFHEATKRNQQREMKIVVTNSVGTSLVQSIVAVPIVVTLLVAVMPSMQISAGSFAAAITAMVMLLRPLRRITVVNNLIQKGVAGAASIFDVLDLDAEKDTGTQTLERARGKIEFDHVEFSYQTSKTPVIRAVNFTVEPGKTVAIVGRSGGGKSTLINLLPRFYDIQQGVIKIDGVDVRDYTLEDLRKQFALVSQHTVLFNDTIANNIAYGLQGKVSESAIIKAATAAHAMEFIAELPDGIHSYVGEDGVLLSGGQKQRIAIARALLKDAPILILDEATASLDTHSERHIQEALASLMQNRTTLVIAHRLSTIEHADTILVLEQGEIIETGTHASLLQQQGAYAHLHRMQFKDEPQSTLV